MKVVVTVIVFLVVLDLASYHDHHHAVEGFLVADHHVSRTRANNNKNNRQKNEDNGPLLLAPASRPLSFSTYASSSGTTTSTTALRYRNDTSSFGLLDFAPSSLRSAPARVATSSVTAGGLGPRKHLLHRRRQQQLKQALAVAAIEDYNMDDFYNAAAEASSSTSTTTIAEDLMKELEQVAPWPHPAQHPLLNARWSFVFTGVPTIGMKLITLLSRLSVGLSKRILEFDNVFLEVSRQQTQVKAIVRVEVCGHPVELNVYTKLQRPTTTTTTTTPSSTTSSWDTHNDVPSSPQQDGTRLIESFDKLVLMGIEIPTPASWKSCRELQITYLDEDMMIARTAGGEPHLLLRHSPCSTDDDTCDLEDEDSTTQFFRDAQAKYGRHLSRSLVDRAYSITTNEQHAYAGNEDGERGPQQFDVANLLQLIRGILAHSRNHRG